MGSRFLALELRPGEATTVTDCALTHASLASADCRAAIFVNEVLIARLDSGLPQTRVCVVARKGETVTVQCNGEMANGRGGVHLLGREGASAARSRRASARSSPPRAMAKSGGAPAMSLETLLGAGGMPTVYTAANPSPSGRVRARTPRLTFNPEVVVAEYVPKRCGISPERSRMSLDEMEAAQVARDKFGHHSSRGEQKGDHQLIFKLCRYFCHHMQILQHKALKGV